MKKQGREMETAVAIMTADDADADAEPIIDLPSRPSSARSIPIYPWRAHWLTVMEFSRMMGRHPQTVYTWLSNGTLSEFGFPVYYCRSQGIHRGRTFIKNVF
jgi:hypothetical protein